MADVNLMRTVTAAVSQAVTTIAADPGTKLEQKDVPAIVQVAAEAARPIVQQAQAHYDFATNNESLATSYSFIGGLTATLGALGTITEKLWDGYIPADDNTALIPALATLIGAAVVLYGRLVAKKPIGS